MSRLVDDLRKLQAIGAEQMAAQQKKGNTARQRAVKKIAAGIFAELTELAKAAAAEGRSSAIHYVRDGGLARDVVEPLRELAAKQGLALSCSHRKAPKQRGHVWDITHGVEYYTEVRVSW